MRVLCFSTLVSSSKEGSACNITFPFVNTVESQLCTVKSKRPVGLHLLFGLPKAEEQDYIE